MQRRGPGLLLRDTLKGDPQVEAVAGIVAEVAPDILVLAGIDWDAAGHALGAIGARIATAGHEMPHSFTAPPNTGLATGRDMDGDGRTGSPRDAQGYGRFRGQGALGVLSRLPLSTDAVRDFTPMLWADLPDAAPPMAGAEPFPDAEGFAMQRLSSTVHWVLPVVLPDGTAMHLLIWKATPPVFDGPEDRNGRRNHDEAALWLHYLDGAFGPPPVGPLAVIGNANLDIEDSNGRPAAMVALLSHPRLFDPRPQSDGGAAAAIAQAGANLSHRGDPALDTADWQDAEEPGNLRVDYILPSRDLTVVDTGVFWPAPDDPRSRLLGGDGAVASRHRLVWVDLELQR